MFQQLDRRAKSRITTTLPSYCAPRFCASNITRRRIAFIRDWYPLPCDFSHSSTSRSRRAVTSALVGLQNWPRTADCHCSSLSSGMSRVSISSSGRAARLDRLAFCAAVRGGNVSKVYLTVFLLITSSLYWRRLSGGNDPHNFATLLIPPRARNQKQWAILNQAARLPPLFAAFDAVLYGYVQRVSKYLAGFFKAHALLSLVGLALGFVPLKPDQHTQL